MPSAPNSVQAAWWWLRDEFTLLRDSLEMLVTLSGDRRMFSVFSCNVHERAPHEPSREGSNQCWRSLQDDLPATHRDVIIVKTCPYAVQYGNVRANNQV